MALHEFDCKGFGQIEPSQVWFNRAGMVEAQCELDPAKFASSFPITPTEATAGKIVAENGAFLVCDKTKKIATLPTAALSNAGWVAGINYSTEKIYNQFTPGRRNFCMVAGEYLPRIGFVEPGMRICTNSVVIDTDSSFVPGTATADEKKSSKYLYDAIKTALAGYNASPATFTRTIYAVLLDDTDYTTETGAVNKGKLVITDQKDLVDKGICGVYAVVTEAYTNADTTLSFKLKFVNKPTLAN